MRCGTTSLRYRSRKRAIRSPVQLVAAAPADAHAASILEHQLAHAHRRVALVAHDHDVGDVNRGFFLDDARRGLRAARLLVPLDHVETLDQRALPAGQHAQNLAGLAALAAGDDHHRIVLLDARSHGRVPHSTSGASDRIFMNCLARSSRATGPKMRVPIGSRWLSMSTAELLSNLM